MLEAARGYLDGRMDATRAADCDLVAGRDFTWDGVVEPDDERTNARGARRHRASGPLSLRFETTRPSLGYAFFFASLDALSFFTISYARFTSAA